MSDADAATDDLDELDPEVSVVDGGADDDLDEAEDIDGNRIEGGVARAVLEYLARSIVDTPDAVRVETDGATLRLHVAPDDMGKVIGRRGRVAQSIRTLVRATAAKEGAEVNVDIVD